MTCFPMCNKANSTMLTGEIRMGRTETIALLINLFQKRWIDFKGKALYFPDELALKANTHCVIFWNIILKWLLYFILHYNKLIHLVILWFSLLCFPPFGQCLISVSNGKYTRWITSEKVQRTNEWVKSLKSKTDVVDKCPKASSVVLICQLSVEILFQIKTSSLKMTRCTWGRALGGANGEREMYRMVLPFHFL